RRGASRGARVAGVGGDRPARDRFGRQTSLARGRRGAGEARGLMETARAYGKLILAGEHAVVYGVPAIAVGIDRGSRAAARPASANRLRIAAWNVDVTERDEHDLARAF